MGAGGHTGKGLEEAVETEKEEAALAMQLQDFFQKELQAKGMRKLRVVPTGL